MCSNHGIFAKFPDFEETKMRAAFRRAIPLKTLVIYCPDPRASGIPAAVAREFEQVYPGEVVRDASGAKVGATNNIAQAITVGGRAIDALRSITTLNHMLGLENVVVVHHTFCGLTAFTPEGLYATYMQDADVDLHGIYQRESLTIDNFDRSLRHDVSLIRNAPGTPGHINIFGYVYDIDTEMLTKVVEDLARGGTITQPTRSCAA